MTHRLTLVLLLAGACGGAPQPASDTTSTPRPAEAPRSAVATITVYTRGTLAGDLATARTRHEDIVRAGQPLAVKAGDLGHHVMLGTGEPSGGKDEFLGLDEWTSLDGPRTFFADPDFQAGLAQLFAEPPVHEMYQRKSDWHGWGDLQPPPGGGPYWVLVVKGHLAKATEEENRIAHDAVAAGFERQAIAAGDISHVPHLAIDDPRVFFNIDVSTSHEGMLAVLQDPQFQQAFGSLFDAPPEVHVYRSTDWHQW